MNFDGLKSWTRISLVDIKDYWVRAGNGLAPLPWERPPQLGVHEAEALLILTANYKLYELNRYTQFYRIMIRDGNLKLVFSDSEEEIIIEAYVLQSLPAAESPFRLRSIFGGKALDSTKDNVIPFNRRKP